MTAAGRFLVRLVSYFSYGLLLVSVFLFSTSELAWLKAFGLLVILFLIDRLAHINKSERPLARLSLKHPNVRCYMAPAAYRALEAAFDRAAIVGGDVVLHSMRELVERPEIRTGLARMDVKSEALLVKIDDYLKETAGEKKTKSELLPLIENVAIIAMQKAKANYAASIEPKDLFTAIGLSGNEYVKRLFKVFAIAPNDLEAALLFSKHAPFTLAGFFSRPFRVRHRPMNRAWTARPTKLLDQFGVDITDLARSGESGFLVGHALEYDRLVNVLSRPGKSNVLLVGEPGAGRETLVHHLAFQMVKDRVPKSLFDKRLVALEVGSIVSGAKEGEVEDRMKRIIREVEAAGNIILYIPEIHNLLKTSGELRMSAADILIPAIQSETFPVIGATYPQEFKKVIEPHTEFASAFEQIRVQELSEAEAVQFLVYESLVIERQSKIMISFGAVKEAVRVAHKYFRTKLLPASADDLLREAVAGAISEHKKIVSAEEVVAVAERRVNVPIKAAGKEEVTALLNLEETIHKKFIDQDEAVRAVSRALREYRSGLSRKGGPIASFLFVGPTGVGKTELSKMLSEVQFGSREFMVRFDMTEYQDKQSFFRFIGSPDGGSRGALTEAILEKPYALILLDEFEKAHPDILNLFLQVFDDGRLTDNLGRTVDFQNTIIIATSNAHSTLIKEEIEKGTPIAAIGEALKKRLTEYFKPELINRFSDIIVFKNLSPADIGKIAKLQLASLADDLREAQGVELTIDESAVAAVATLGYDPVFGARPLRKVISEKFRSVLAEKILKNEIEQGGSLKVAHDGKEFVFSTVNN